MSPKYEELTDAFELPGMKEAGQRIMAAADKGERVLIYGDYDVDGVTASTVMHDALRLAGVKTIEVMLPDRFKDGYGMSKKAVDRVREGGFSLVVTVDCGSRNFEVIEALREAGADVIVTDHHECEEKLPAAVAVVNPKRRDFDGGALRDLAGVGVAFEVARALVKLGRIADGQEKWLLDLVVVGTLCDSMRISRENRILTYYGAKVLMKTRRPGLRELMRVGNVDKPTAQMIGYRLGPMLNAAGRLASAKIALDLLMTKDPTEAVRLAVKLDDLNGKRRDLQTRALDEIRVKGVGKDKVIVVEGDWHEGVLGIIAGKLVDEYRRPAFVLAKADVDGDGIVDVVYKGSGRSFGEFNLAEALCECQNCKCLLSGGGHAEACGVKVAVDKLAEFRSALNNYYESLHLGDQERFLRNEADIVVEAGEMGGVTAELAEDFERLEPYGAGNEEPLIKFSGVTVAEVRRMGANRQHLALGLAGSGEQMIRTVAFGAPETWMRMEQGQVVDAWVRLVINEFRGRRSVEGMLERLEVVG